EQGRRAYVALHTAGVLAVVDLEAGRVIREVPVGAGPVYVVRGGGNPLGTPRGGGTPVAGAPGGLPGPQAHPHRPRPPPVAGRPGGWRSGPAGPRSTWPVMTRDSAVMTPRPARPTRSSPARAWGRSG